MAICNFELTLLLSLLLLLLCHGYVFDIYKTNKTVIIVYDFIILFLSSLL